MPDTGPVIYALTTGGVECTEFADKRNFIRCRDNDKPVMILHRDKGLRSQRMTFDHFNGDRLGTGLAPEDTDQRFTAVGGNVNTGEVVESVGGSFVDRQALCAVRLDNITKGCEGLLGERGREQFQRVQGQSSCANGPKIRTRLMPPSGKMLRRMCVMAPRSLIAAPSKSWI